MDIKFWGFLSLPVLESWLNVEMILERTKGTLSEDGLLVQIFPRTLSFHSSVTVTFHHGNPVLEAMLM